MCLCPTPMHFALTCARVNLKLPINRAYQNNSKRHLDKYWAFIFALNGGDRVFF